MADERSRIPAGELARWLLVAVLIGAGRDADDAGHQPMTQIRLTLPDNSVREVPAGTTSRDVAQMIGPGLAKAAIAARVDGAVWDLDRPIARDAGFAILTDRDPDALEVLRHSTAHILATDRKSVV